MVLNILMNTLKVGLGDILFTIYVIMNLLMI